MNASGAKDTDLIEDIITDELAKLILINKNQALFILNKNGIKVNKDEKPEKIIELISENIDTNKKLLSDISNAIRHKNQEDLRADGFLNGDGSKVKLGDILKDETVQGTVSDTLAALLTKKNKKKSQSTQKKVIEKVNVYQNKPKKSKSHVWVYVGISAAILATVITIVILKKNKK